MKDPSTRDEGLPVEAPPGAAAAAEQLAAAPAPAAPAAAAAAAPDLDDEDADFAELVQPRADDAFSRRESITGPPPERTPHFGAALHRWGLLGRLFARLFFSRIFFPAESVAAIRKAAERGTVIYVLRLRHTLEFLYFNYAFAAHGLPLARFANGVRSFFWQPLRLLLRRLLSRERRDPLDTLRRLTRAHRSSTIFLRNSSHRPPSDFRGPYLETLIEAQQATERPIVLVPLTVLWRTHGIAAPKGWLGVLDRLIGDQDEPRMFRRVWQVLRRARRSIALACEPLDLQQFLAERPADEQPATALRETLLQRIEAERRVRLGPHRAHFIEIRRRILERPEVREELQRRAEATRQSVKRVTRKAWRTLKRMQAQLSPRGLQRLSRLIRMIIWRRTFEGFEVDEEGVSKLQEAGKSGPLIYLPSHRSHIDYLVLSDLLVARDLLPPHIAAGANLSFWPMGWLFRTAGAFFIRRSYQGDDLYAALLRAYVSETLREGHNIEVFIEGGRTRTGRLLPPKLGLLSMIADVVAHGEIPAASVVPVSIGYERLVELTSLTRELSGGKKQAENVRGLLKAGKVVRTKRSYGFVNVQFGDPIDIGRFLAKRGFSGASSPPEARQRAIRSLGYHAISAAGAVTAVTPTSLCAAALLAPGSRGVKASLLRRAAELIARTAATASVRFTSGLKSSVGLPDEAFARALEMLERDGAIRTLGGDPDRVYVAEELQRIRLEYYKNVMLPHVVAPAVVSMVLRALKHRAAPPFPRQAVDDASRFVTSLVRLHLVNHAGIRIEALGESTYARLEQLQLIRRDGESIDLAPASDEPLDLLAGLVENLIESQTATAQALLMLRAGPLARDVAEANVLGQLHRRYIVGDLLRQESCQLPLVKVAIDWLREEGIIEQRDGGEIALAREHADGRALEVFVERTASLVPKPTVRFSSALELPGEQAAG